MPVWASTQTENYGISVLLAPGKVVIAGASDDRDLTGGNFACDNVEEQRDHHSAWLHAMYDQDNSLPTCARHRQLPSQRPTPRRQHAADAHAHSSRHTAAASSVQRQLKLPDSDSYKSPY